MNIKIVDFDFFIPEHCLVEVAKQNVPDKQRFCSIQYKYDAKAPQPAATLKVTHITMSPEQLTHVKNTPLLYEVIEVAAKNHLKSKI
jgi:hypothetical protein